MKRRSILKSALCLVAGLGVAQSRVAVAGDTKTDGGHSGSNRSDKTVAFTVSIRVKPGREEAFLRLLEPVLDAMRHETTFINAVLHRDSKDPSHFMIYETWADFDDVVQTQVHRDYRKTYMERLPEILSEERDIAIWQPLRGDFRFSAEQNLHGG